MSNIPQTIEMNSESLTEKLLTLIKYLFFSVTVMMLVYLFILAISGGSSGSNSPLHKAKITIIHSKF